MTDATLPRAYSYIRMSTDQQIKGDSLRRQLEMSRAYADQHGLQLDDSLRDIGVSAWQGKNRREGALSGFLQLVQQGQIPPGSHLLVESLDRLSREEVFSALQLFVQILQGGIIIVTLADNQLYSQANVGSDWTKLIISLTVMARAHEESQRKSQRVREANADRHRRALEGTASFHANTPGWINRRLIGRGHYEFTLNEHASTIRRIFELTAQGVGQLKVARFLNDEGIPSVTGKQWYQGSVGSVLRNRNVLGEFQPKTTIQGETRLGDVIPDYYPPVISHELWTRAQSNRQKVTSPGRKADMANLFGGIVHCVHCGGRMNIRTIRKTHSTQRYLFCVNNMRNTCNSSTTFRYDVVETAILDHVTEFQLSELFDHGEVAKQLEAIRVQIAEEAASVENLKQRETRLAEQLEFATPATAPSIHRLMEQRVQEYRTLEKNLQRLKQDQALLEARMVDRTQTETMVREARASWLHLQGDPLYKSRAQVSSALKSFIEFIMFNGDKHTYTVVLGGGISAYEFRGSQLRNQFNAVKSGFINEKPGGMREEHFASDLPRDAKGSRLRLVQRIARAS